MYKITKDKKYIEIVNHILMNKEFNKIDKIEHHGITRYEHSLKVSYYSYKIAKTLKLNYIEVARGGLLHDFFLSNENRTDKEKFISTFTHPKKALKKTKETFDITELEGDIIKSHMFPVNLTIPKYMESWLVNITDKVIGGYEFLTDFFLNFNHAANYIYIFVLFNLIK